MAGGARGAPASARGTGEVDTGEALARRRVEAVYAAVDRMTPEQLSWSTLPARDLEERTVLLAALEHAADRHGRGTLVDQARARLRDALGQRLLARSSSAEAGAIAISRIGRVEDIASVQLAIEDAVSVAVTEDLLLPAYAAALADPGRRLLGLAPLAGSSLAPVPPALGWEPSPADWAAAEGDGPAAVDPEAPVLSTSRMRAATFGTIGAIGVFVAVAYGLAQGDWLLAVLAAIAVVALAWTFATYRPARRA